MCGPSMFVQAVGLINPPAEEPPMRSTTVVWLAAALAIAGAPAPANAAPTPSGTFAATMPAGWSITAGPALTWRSPTRVPLGAAPVEFFIGDRSLGTARASSNRRVFRIDLPELTGPELASLRVRVSGRGLDVAAPRVAGSAVPALAASLAAPVPIDPGAPGTYATVTGEYTLQSVALPGMAVPADVRGVVVAPPRASGPLPLVVFLHGRHETCFGAGDVTGEWPCPAGQQPIPSHRGYLGAQKLLASQGYVTVSVDANSINAQDGDLLDLGNQARSDLVRLHLGRWAGWSSSTRLTAPAIVRQAPPADLSKVLLVGHSVGGEGVNQAALDTISPRPGAPAVRWTLGGVVHLAPTSTGQNPAPDIPSVTILPGCDGDVSTLEGEIYVDGTRGVSKGSALHSAVYMVGANHNFFNTEWTPGQAQAPAVDDAHDNGSPDPVCAAGAAPTRLTAAQQQTAGATYIAAAARLFLTGDDRARPLLDGSGVRAASADPARVLSHAVGGARTAVVVPNADTTVTGSGARLCAAVDTDPAVACLGDGERSPHFTTFRRVDAEPGRSAIVLIWSAPGGAVSVTPPRPVAVSGTLAMRIIVPPNTTETQLDVAAVDTAGRRTALGQVRLDGLPGSTGAEAYWAQEVRVPIRTAITVAALELVPRSESGRAWLIDAWDWRPGTPAARPGALPRVDAGFVSVDEGDHGVRTVSVPLTVAGRGTGKIRIFLEDPTTSTTSSRIATVNGGQTVNVPIPVTGNIRYGRELRYRVHVKAIRGAVVGATEGRLHVRNDDPMPMVTVAPMAERVAEGEAMRWRVTLSTPADVPIYTPFRVLAPISEAELSTTDVQAAWFTDTAYAQPLPSRPMSATHDGYPLEIAVEVPEGQLSAELVAPTIVDNLAEPDEQLRVVATPSAAGDELPPVDSTITVVGGS
jgi:hypothetical protein